MSAEQFYWFVDIAAVDPMLRMAWATFLDKYPWRRRALEDHLKFVLEPQPDDNEIAAILKRRDVRWALKHAQPAYYFLDLVVHHVPRLRKMCPQVWPADLFEFVAIESTAVEAFLKGYITARTLWAVNNLNGAEDPRAWLDLSKPDWLRVQNVRRSGPIEKPIFRWQNQQALNEGYRCLGVPDTKRFIKFLLCAWEGNWPVPRIRRDLEATRGLVTKALPRFRDFRLARELVRCASHVKLKQTCALQYFELRVM